MLTSCIRIRPIEEFLVIFAMVSSTIIDQEDSPVVPMNPSRTGELGQPQVPRDVLKPELHTRRVISMSTVINGLADGIHAAEA